MKKRLALLWTPLLLGAALLFPGSTMAATGVTFSVTNQHCYGSQGQDVSFDVRVTATGASTANKLTTTAVSQYFSGGRWHTYYHFSHSKHTFKADGTTHYWDSTYTHEGTNQYNWRIVASLAAYNGRHLLAKKTLKSKAC